MAEPFTFAHSRDLELPVSVRMSVEGYYGSGLCVRADIDKQSLGRSSGSDTAVDASTASRS